MNLLDLSNNRIAILETNALNTLKNLRHLHLSFNYLDGLGMGLFTGLTQLRLLYLSFNYIKVLSGQFFGDFLKSSKILSSYLCLNLSNNQMKIIEKTGLDSLKWFSFVLIEKESSLEELDSNIIEFDLNDEIKNEIKEIINVDDETIGEKEVDINENLSLDCVKEQSVSNTRDEKGLDSFLVEW